MSPAPSYTTKELSPETWKDFERLFAKYNGVQAGCWCMFYQRPGPLPAGSRSPERNRRDKRSLARRGQAHGILVYAGDQAVGWCQFGMQAELPRVDAGRLYRKLGLSGDRAPLWRITCFFVDRDFRRQGVAEAALRAALEAIHARGGGTVEAYPWTNPGTVSIWSGSVGMFERQRFQKVAPLGRSTQVMRRRV